MYERLTKPKEHYRGNINGKFSSSNIKVNTRYNNRINNTVLPAGTIQCGGRNDNNYTGILYGDHMVYSATQPTTQAGTVKLLNTISDKEWTLIISGTHGDKQGISAASNKELKEIDFYKEDMAIVKALKRRKVIVVAAEDLTQEELDTAIYTGEFEGEKYANIVLAYCYARRAQFPLQ
ncbi:hypothetical protein PRUB_b1117 [Pseudoalteromonas rubra]|uniref:Uncharacterized protein n=1 Tax=Pseudoalteromonas rubra TaxID=43658 RepID=A0A8T0C391_9GAMM|nr:hypothetical protein [Pseudoalteromonas rubra]KAF7781787.1 hypothetical protein PRUB_b1117 [Pseudoalteromonas rubra]